MTPLKTQLAAIRWRLTVMLAALSLVLVACDIAGGADTEDLTSFEGPPQVVIASPLNGDTYQEGVGVNILLRVDNAGPDIARIAISVDDQIIGEAVLPNPNGDASFTVNNGWPASGVGQHTISAVASRSDGTVSPEASVTINVVANDADTASPQDTSDNDTSNSSTDNDSTSGTTDNNSGDAPAQNTNPPLPTPVPTQVTPPTEPPTQTPVPPTNTPSVPTVQISTGANVRSGPGLVFDPPIGSLAAGASAEILAVNTAGTWYKIRYYNGEGWVSAQVATVNGDIASLPREAGPPTPVPPTPVPPTNTPLPASNVDLIIDAAQTAVVPTFRCLLASEIRITVVNTGTERSAGTNVVAEDVQPNGTVGDSTQGVVPPLDPGQSTTVVMYLTVSTFVNEQHTFRARVDANGSIAESNENNNTYTYDYVLEPGNC